MSKIEEYLGEDGFELSDEDIEYSLEFLMAEYGIDEDSAVSAFEDLGTETEKIKYTVASDTQVFETEINSQDLDMKSSEDFEKGLMDRYKIETKTEEDFEATYDYTRKMESISINDGISTDDEDDDVKVYNIKKPSPVSEETMPFSSVVTASFEDDEDDDVTISEGFSAKPISEEEFENTEKQKFNFNKPKALIDKVQVTLAAIKVKQMLDLSMNSSQEEEYLGEEMDAEEASNYYKNQAQSMVFRLRVAAFFSLVLVWISCGFPIFGALSQSSSVRALVCIILEITVIMCCLDIFTSGMMGLVRGRMSLWSLLSLSAIMSLLDALVCVGLGTAVVGTPFCAVTAVSFTFSLYGAYKTAVAYHCAMRTLVDAENLSDISVMISTPEEMKTGDEVSGTYLMRGENGAAGFIRSCEQADPMESFYSYFAPILIIVALLFSIVATIVSGEFTNLFRCLAIFTSLTAPVAAFLAFPLAYSKEVLSGRKLAYAIAGWAGTQEIGKNKNLIVKDEDLFPKNTISIDQLKYVNGGSKDKLITSACTLLVAAGGNMATASAEFMSKHGYELQMLEDFDCHEGGGVSAMVNGEKVVCASATYMQMIGVHLPAQLQTKDTIFVTIDGAFAGLITFKYSVISKVQEGLFNITNSKQRPIFAVRDFNVTPQSLKHKFKLATSDLDFPSYNTRFELSEAIDETDSVITAVMGRAGLDTMILVAGRGRNLYLSVCLASIMAVLCTIIGLIWSLYTIISSGLNILTVSFILKFMLIWLVPILIGNAILNK